MGRDGTYRPAAKVHRLHHPYNSKTHPEVNDKYCEAFRLLDVYGKCIVVIEYGLRMVN